MSDWTIEGAEGEPILGSTDEPAGDAVGTILIAHGFKGYKDYGMFPRIARTCADHGLVAHRFNFSHSGMTANVETFDRPDLFEHDTWNKQVYDYRAVIEALTGGELAGHGLPFVLFGHSRGGVTALLTVGRHAGDAAFPQPAGLITAAAPSFANGLTDEQQEALLAEGFLLSPSARTGQDLRVGRAFLAEQLEDPPGHDVIGLASRIRCPVLILHGQEDPTVPAACATALGDAIGSSARVEVIAGADHVFNTPNPLPADATPSPQLQALLDVTASFALRCVTGSSDT